MLTHLTTAMFYGQFLLIQVFSMSFIELSLFVVVPHIWVRTREENYDFSVDATISPNYPHQLWPSHYRVSPCGVFWNRVFLQCGGYFEYSSYNASNQCYHRQVGGSVESVITMVEPRTRSSMVIAGGWRYNWGFY